MRLFIHEQCHRFMFMQYVERIFIVSIDDYEIIPSIIQCCDSQSWTKPHHVQIQFSRLNTHHVTGDSEFRMSNFTDENVTSQSNKISWSRWCSIGWNCYDVGLKINSLTVHCEQLQANPYLYDYKYHRNVLHRYRCLHSISHSCLSQTIARHSNIYLFIIFQLVCLFEFSLICGLITLTNTSPSRQQMFRLFVVYLSQHIRFKNRCLSFRSRFE